MTGPETTSVVGVEETLIDGVGMGSATEVEAWSTALVSDASLLASYCMESRAERLNVGGGGARGGVPDLIFSK